MTGKYIFFAVAAALGVSAANGNALLLLSLFAAYALFLGRFKLFSIKRILSAFAVFLIFFASATVYLLLNNTVLSGKETEFAILFNKELKINGDVLTAFALDKASGEKLAVRYRFRTEKEKELLSHSLLGNRCSLAGQLEEPDLPRNKNAFNYRSYLKREGIHWILNIEKIDLQTCEPRVSPIIFLKMLRQKGIEYISNNFREESAQVSAALIFGERDLYDPEILETYERIGIVHLLAISGLQVSLLSGMVYFGGIRLGITKEKMQNALLIVLPVYGILTGASPSVMRAVVMTMLVLISLKFGSRTKLLPIDAVSLTLMLFLLLAPFSLYSPGFQLSFAVSFCLILSPSIMPGGGRPVILMLTTTFIAQLASMPILLFHFYEISVISLLANLLFVPLYSFVFMPISLVAFILYLIAGKLAVPLAVVFDILVVYSNRLAEKLSLLPLSSLILGKPNGFSLFMYVFAVPVFFCLWEKKKTLSKFLLIPFIPIILQGASNYYSPNGEVTFIDVGQGESILIRLPYGNGTYLIDTGGTMQFEKEVWQERKKQFEPGKDVVVPFLKSKGISTIDKLILTHGDADHIGGALALLEEIRVKEILTPLTSEKSELETVIFKKARQKKIPVKYAGSKEGWKSGNSLFQIMLPQENQSLEGNNNSIVILAEMGGLRWLFTGDLEKEGEEALLKKYNETAIDVLKVGHHGSKFSTTEELLDRYNPKAAVISAGENNRYGHPHEEVLKRLKERKIKTFRTDVQGAVTYTFRGESGTFSAILP